MCILASHSAQKKGHGRQSRQRTTAVLLRHCWQMWVSTFSCATAVLTRRGLSALQLSAKRLFRVLQFDEARREVLGVGASTSSPVASLSDCWRSRRNPSVKKSKVSVLYGVVVKGTTAVLNSGKFVLKYEDRVYILTLYHIHHTPSSAQII